MKMNSQRMFSVCTNFLSHNFHINNIIITSQNLYHSKSTSACPLSIYDSKISEGELSNDECQRKVVLQLQRVYNDLADYEPPRKGFFKFLPFKFTINIPKGVYLHGSVGGGKTMLMDLFFNCCQMEEKRRVHFNEFMLEVHSRIHELKKTVVRKETSTKPVPYDPIGPVARLISEKTWLLCFDEFQVTDIGDAMILKRLFTELFDNGVVVVATSNRPPDDLYKNGLQRSNFLPFIPILKAHCEVIDLNSGIDYRVRNLDGKASNFFVKSSCEANTQLDNIFKYLSSLENDIVRPKTLTYMGRNVTFQKCCGQVLNSSFSELCDRPLGASDYLQLCQAFHTIFIRDIPQLSLRYRSQARRFIILIDTLYDNNVNLIASAEFPIPELFLKDSTYHEKDEARILMDDLNIHHGEENAASSIFTGDEEIFAFDRTLSRLLEMQSPGYKTREKIKLN